MTWKCNSCQKIVLNNSLKKLCISCQGEYCSNCLYQRIAVPKQNYQMHEVCTQCFRSISEQMALQKPPKGFLQRLDQQNDKRNVSNDELDPETRALEQRLQRLRESFSTSSKAAVSTTMESKKIQNPDDLVKQINDELSIQDNDAKALEQRLRILHETLPPATPDTVVLPKKPEIEQDDHEEEFPWCTVCNENATKRCLDCDELFCESCLRKIHRQSGYKNHEVESYRPSDKVRKKYNY